MTVAPAGRLSLESSADGKILKVCRQQDDFQAAQQILGATVRVLPCPR